MSTAVQNDAHLSEKAYTPNFGKNATPSSSSGSPEVLQQIEPQLAAEEKTQRVSFASVWDLVEDLVEEKAVFSESPSDALRSVWDLVEEKAVFSEASSDALGVKYEDPDCDPPDWGPDVADDNTVEMTFKFEEDVKQQVSDSAAASLDQDAQLQAARQDLLPSFLHSTKQLWSKQSHAFIKMQAMKGRAVEHVRWRAVPLQIHDREIQVTDEEDVQQQRKMLAINIAYGSILNTVPYSKTIRASKH